MSAIDAIGRTPVVRLERLAGDDAAEVFVKLEGANPTGSYKDRMALAMIEAAERDGRLQPGQAVVEYTGGSTGSSLAFVCAVKGHPLRIVSSDAFAVEKIRTMEAFGARVELIPSPAGITPDLIPAMVRRAAEIAEDEGAFWTDQLNNADSIDGYRRIGEELVEQLPGPPALAAFCSYVGTAGCLLGTTRALRAAFPELQRVAVEPAESAVLSGGEPGTHHIEGGGIGYPPPLLATEDFDEVVAVPEAEAFAMAATAAHEEGVFSGPSTGANLVAALQIAAPARRRQPGRHSPGRQWPEVSRRQSVRRGLSSAGSRRVLEDRRYDLVPHRPRGHLVAHPLEEEKLGAGDLARERLGVALREERVFGAEIPCSFVALGTGVTLALTSGWGLLRYWWVTAKLARCSRPSSSARS